MYIEYLRKLEKMSNLETLKKHNFNFNKAFGQNFIFDSNLLEKIVDDAGVDESTTVLEIGCGAGTLTKHIAKRVKRVVGYEIDTNLRPVLAENLADCPNVEINFADVMKVSIKEIEEKLNDEYVIVANLPYYITTPIIFKFLQEAKRLKRLVIMVQLEVAERLCAKENTTEYGTITVAIDSVANAKIMRIVKKNMFTPQPKIDSAIVRIDFEEKYKITDTEILNKLIRGAFQNRRKTLSNNLKATFALNSTQISEIFEKLNISETVRGEGLSTMQFVGMSNILAEKLKK